MAKGLERFSPDDLKERAAVRGKHHDGGGLYLIVGRKGAPGACSWQFRYMADGKERTVGLGGYPALPMRDARRRAADLRRERANGNRDPLSVRKAAKEASRLEAATAITFRQAADAYINGHKAGWRNPVHARQWTSTLDTYAFPFLADLPVRAVDTRLVTQVLEQPLDGESLWTARPETANRLRGRLEAILSWAKVRGYRTGENPAAWKGHLDHALPARNKVRRVKHHAAIAIDGLPAFVGDLRQKEGTAARALEFAIHTAARTGEVIGARWAEIDLEAKTWIVPAERMKAAREHRVPLSDPAVTLLEVIRDEAGAPAGDAFVFPGPSGGQMSNMAFNMLLRRMKRTDLTAHGFRSTFSDWIAERTNFPSEARELALAHAVGDKVEAAYRRGDQLAKRVQMMDAWSAFCMGKPMGSNVDQLANRRAGAGS